MLTFEGTQLQGVEAIVEKLSSLPFQKVEHKVSTRDCQPTGDGNSLVVIVTGALMVDDSPAPLNFSQVSERGRGQEDGGSLTFGQRQVANHHSPYFCPHPPSPS